MSWIILIMHLQLPRSIGNYLTMLHQNIAKSHLRCITVNHKPLLSFNQGQNQSQIYLILQLLETTFTSIWPRKFDLLLSSLSQRSSYRWKAHHKSLIIPNQTQKTLNVRSSHGSRPLLHHNNLLWIHHDPLTRNNMTKESYSAQPKLIFRELDIQLLFL